MGFFSKVFGKSKAAATADNTVASTKAVTERVLNKFKLKTRVEAFKKIVLNLAKNAPDTAAVTLVLDKSFSMQNLYKKGKVQDIIERVLPLGMQFDDNGAVDVFSFSSKGSEVYHGEMTETNAANFVANELDKVPYGGTDYAPIIEKIAEEAKGSKIPLYVLFITDGDCSDKGQTKAAMIDASRYPVFFQFVGIGGASFNFLKTLDNMPGRLVDNADFFEVNDLDDMTDHELYTKLMTEYPTWCAEAKDKSIY